MAAPVESERALEFLQERVQNAGAYASGRSLDSFPPDQSGHIIQSSGVSVNSFTITAIDNVAINPELVAEGYGCIRLCALGKDYAGDDRYEPVPR